MFFERDGGFLEPGTVLEMYRERATGRVLAVVQYQDKTWAKYAGYNQHKDVEELLVHSQLVTRSRTRRPPRPITRYQPPVEAPKPGRGKGSGGGGGGGGYKTALPVDEEKEQRKRERAERRRKKLRRQKREAARKRLEARRRRRVLGRRWLEEGAGSLEAEEAAELRALLELGQEGDGDEEEGEAETTMAVRMRSALERVAEEEGPMWADDAMDVTSSDGEGALSSSSSSSDGSGSSCSSSGESSAFPEPDSPSEREPTSESDVGCSDVSTDSCPSEPEYLYWPRLATPDASERKVAGLQRFGLCPKVDSDESEASGM